MLKHKRKWKRRNRQGCYTGCQHSMNTHKRGAQQGTGDNNQVGQVINKKANTRGRGSTTDMETRFSK